MTATPTSSADQTRSGRWWARRVVVALVLVLQLVALLNAYRTPLTPFGWQMFPTSDEWQADIVRITADGTRVDIRGPWPGGIVWSEVVEGHGLGHPFHRHHADHGMEVTFNFLEVALDWVADNIPADAETVRIEAVVTYWDNGRGPFEETLTSRFRTEASP